MTRTIVEIRLDAAFSARRARWGLLALLLAALPESAAPAERAVLTNYYPSPAGVYRTLMTTGETFVARDSGEVQMVGPSNPGCVGVGTTNPRQRLHVSGNLKVTGCIFLGPTKRCAW